MVERPTAARLTVYSRGRSQMRLWKLSVPQQKCALYLAVVGRPRKSSFRQRLVQEARMQVWEVMVV